MNFFEHQDRARSSTRLLVFLFVSAVATLIIVTTVLVVFLLTLARENGNSAPTFELSSLSVDVLVGVTVVVLGVVLLGTGYRLSQLRGGGSSVAESLGGRLLNVQTRDADERKILNVVEEMAIAAGLPVPQVYLIEDQAINAFAAGYRKEDAVIGVTRGAISELDRDELQGVVAHEFSHILNGDMRLNIRLMGWLYGITVLGLIGYYLLRSSRYGGRRSGKKGAGIAVLLGLGLVVIGYGGTFFGNLIKAAVSRQREFLADASAVQYTRNPGGIGGALKKIGGYAHGTRITATDTHEIGHMLFGQGAGLAGLFATHPPIDERIRRLEPQWKGEQARRASPAHVDSSTTSSAAPAMATGLVERVGQPDSASLTTAQAQLRDLPAALYEEAHSSLGASMLIYALIFAVSGGEALAAQRDILLRNLPPESGKLLERLQEQVNATRRESWLALVDLALPSLRELSVRQRKDFMAQLRGLIEADKRVSVFEWCLFRILRTTLQPAPLRGAHVELATCAAECRVVLAAVARAGNVDEASAAAAVAAGLTELQQAASGPVAAPDAAALDAALEKLRHVKPLQKPRLLKALVVCVRQDGKVSGREAELLRTVGAVLDCPVPPLA